MIKKLSRSVACAGILKFFSRQRSHYCDFKKSSKVVHTTIVFARYIVLSWQHRCSTDNRTLGGLFYDLCDQIEDLDWAVALQQLVELLQNTLKHVNRKIQEMVKSQLMQWVNALPNYIKAYLPVLVCES